jgi:hypothetical protein
MTYAPVTAGRISKEMRMTSTRRWLRTFVMAGVATLSATVASPQSVGEPHVNGHQDQIQAMPLWLTAQSMAGGRHDVMARMAALDEQIQTLTTDMNMFAGELKVRAMADLLTAMVERQSIMRNEMMPMRDRMMRHRTTGDTISSVPPDVDPDTMCVAEAVSPRQ